VIITETDDCYRFITQNDHARLSGQFADHWGNDQFDDPDPKHAVVVAADYHDVGWTEYDLRPRWVDGGPRNFLQSPRDRWIEFYEEGIDTVAEIDAYAGLLASMHGAGVRRQRYGTQPSMPDREHDYSSFVAEQEALQRRLLADLQTSERYGDSVTDDDAAVLESIHEHGRFDGAVSDSGVWYNYALLQLFDRLSLYLCRNDELESTTLGPVPVAYDVGATRVRLDPASDDRIRLDPYPFDDAPLTVSVDGRRVPKGAFETEAELVAAYFQAGRERFEFTLSE
jgi:hypothetical protein